MIASEALECVRRCVKGRHFGIYERAYDWSDAKIAASKEIIDQFMQSQSLPTDKVAFLAVGSIGRREALEASDLDIVPVCADELALECFAPYDKPLRKALFEGLNIKVSEGADLTKAVSLDTLTDPEGIGGKSDNSGSLTKRVLLLTESVQLAGSLDVAVVRKRILDAYAAETRTSGRHVLSLCNDIARYYKTLCIEYKAKIDEEDKDWCTRNMKLRHSRKLWYFSNIVSLSLLADQHPQGETGFVEAVLATFSMTPAERIASQLWDRHPLSVGTLLENYALYLDFMSKPEKQGSPQQN